LNISGTLGGRSVGDSNKMVRSLLGVVVVEVAADMVVVVNVVVDGMAELVEGLVGADEGWHGREMLVYKTGERGMVTVMVVAAVVLVVTVVLELGLL